VYLRSATKISKEDLIALQAAARMVVVAARGTLRQQLAATTPVTVKPQLLSPGWQFREEPSAPLAFVELKYFNGLGGFTQDGKEFVIYLGPGQQTPLPWVNIMGNSKFGALVSESGAGVVWGSNCRNDRLTPWFNDPISDPPGTAIYIRDDDLGVVWSPTPQPIRESDAYRARHGQGYTTFEHNSHAIEQELVTFVPLDEAGGLPVRLQRLRLRNSSLHDPAATEHERLTGDTGAGLDPCAALQVVVEIDPEQSAEITFLLGQADDEEKARALVNRFRDPANVEAALEETRRWWDRLLDTIEVKTPELSTNFLLNRWLLYQTLSCRVWGRSALYQSSGAYGFRDQLQDVMALVHAAPEIARNHILRAAARQFVEGDVQHWWHPESGVGVRTRISDDLLWLPFVTAHYV